MSLEVTATLVNDETGFTFLTLAADDLPYMVLDRAETELRGHDRYAELKAAAEPAGDGTERLEVGTVTVTEDGSFEGLTVTA